MAHDEDVADELGEAASAFRSALTRLRKRARRVDSEIREVMADESSSFGDRREQAALLRAQHADEIERLARRVESCQERSLDAVRRLHSTRSTEDEARSVALALLQSGVTHRQLIAQAQALGDYPTLEALVKLVRYTYDPGSSHFIDAEAAEEAVAHIEEAMLALAPQDEAEALEAARWIRSGVADEAEATLKYALGVARGDGGPGERMMLGLVRGEAG